MITRSTTVLSASAAPRTAMVLNNSDLFIVLGSRLSDMTICNLKPENHPQQLIQFDVDPTFVGKILTSSTIAVGGDLRDNLALYLQKLDPSAVTKHEINISNDYNDELPVLAGLSLASVMSTMSEQILQQQRVRR